VVGNQVVLMVVVFVTVMGVAVMAMQVMLYVKFTLGRKQFLPD